MKLAKMEKIRLFPNEEVTEIELPEKLKFRYAISNKGRLFSFVDSIDFGRELKGSLTDGYRLFKYKSYAEGVIKNKHLFYCKLVAQYFIPKNSEDQIYVLHLDRIRNNDDYRNLKWATKEEWMAHSQQSPAVKQAFKNLQEFNLKADGRKLTVTKVMLIKKMLANPNRTTRIKMIAKQFGVSEMQISRIKSGENWSHIKI